MRRYKDSNELSPLFCVETSCTLVEVAWQAYYDPHRVNLADFVAPGRQDLSYLGLELVVGENVAPVVRGTLTTWRCVCLFSLLCIAMCILFSSEWVNVKSTHTQSE